MFKKSILFFCIFLLVQECLQGQNSFVKIVETSPDSFFPGVFAKIGIGANNEMSALVNDDFHSTGFLELNSKGEKIGGFKILAPPFRNFDITFKSYFRFENKHLLIAQHSKIPVQNGYYTSQIYFYDTETGKSWSKKLGGRYALPLYGFISGSDYVITGRPEISLDSSRNYIPMHHISISKLDLDTGNSEWDFKFNKKNGGVEGYLVHAVKELPDKNILIFFSRNMFDNNTSKIQIGLLKISPTGSILDNLIFENLELRNYLEQTLEVDTEGSIYITGDILNQTDWNNSNQTEGIIIKLRSNLELDWAKRLSAENFTNGTTWMQVIPISNEGIFFTYKTIGVFPTMFGKISTSGILGNVSGKAFWTPQIAVGIDNSLFITSERKFSLEGKEEKAFLIAKTNPDGTIDGCDEFDACLTLFDINVTTTKWDWERDTLVPLPEVDFVIESLDFTLTDHCGTPRPPTPFFALPDTICQNQTLRPDSLYNHLAHATEWTITSQNTNLELADTSWNYQFTEPGTYQIEQEIWLLGCSEFFTRTLVVLPDRLGNLLGEDRLICEDNPLSLSPTAARPLRSFEWSNGSNDSNITISNSGTYAVTASDGFCSSSDEIELTFFKEKYTNDVFELPTDSAVCVDLLPLSLTPTSELTDSFYLANSTIPQTVFELKTEGNYQISAQIENCRVEKNFELKITPCEIDIFFPNTFSPNDDGINDFAEPFGKEFDGLSLEIFNRWGGKVFESTAAPFAWDGNFNGKKANEGVYVFVFKYRNQRNGLEEMVSGDVLLMR